MKKVLTDKLSTEFSSEYDIYVGETSIYFLEKGFLSSKPNISEIVLSALVVIIYNTEAFSFKLATCKSLSRDDFWARIFK